MLIFIWIYFIVLVHTAVYVNGYISIPAMSKEAEIFKVILGPEALHLDAVALAPVVSFMIRQAEWLFQAPAQLATDVAAYFTMRERRRAMSPDVDLDESISDRTAANTVYTFVDRHRTTVENQANPTDTALAQLYAHIQALPDSQHKRRLIKQFNRQNGYGTPIQVQRTGKAAGSKSLGESIKRHIFNKGLLNKTPKKSSSGSIPSVSEKRSPFSKQKLRFSSEDSGKTLEVSHKNIILKNLAHKMASAECLDNVEDYDSDASDDSTQSEGSLLDRAHKMSPKFVSEPNLSILDSKLNEETPKNTRKRTRLFQSKVISASNLNNKYASKKSNNARSTPTSCVSCVDEQDTATDSDTSVADVKNYHKALAASPSVSNVTARLSRRDSMRQVQYRIFPTENDSGDCGEVKSLSKMNYLTSTPGNVVCESEEPTTPYFSTFRRASMSPITKSTQKLSKAMQESIMTPRSRKPLIIMSEQRDASLVETKKPDTSDSPDTIYGSISPKNDSDFVSSDESEQRSYSSGRCENVRTSYHKNSIKVSATDVSPHVDSLSVVPNFKTSHEMSPFYLKDCKSRSLTDPFREYLLSRSVLTAAPVDLSLVNRSEDGATGESISDSLMFCLDGNVPSDLTSSISNLVVDKVMSDEKSDVPRSPLKNLRNYINTTKLTESPKRKRSAAVHNTGREETGAGTYKKISLTPEAEREKENLTERERNISLWETDL